MPLGSNQYYECNIQQISPMYDKSKKTWSQRLKISKSDKPPPPPITEFPDFPVSGLSRSMKYAEPWLYGTVRGIPARPVHGHAIFAPMPAEVAVVVCSCPEYLSGTKRDVKKASICKKCKGSRLPWAPIGGTVRIRPTTAPIVHKTRGSAGTMRLPSTSNVKSRPSILDPQNDPYDLMRRSRLLSPEPKPVKSSDKSLRNRAKSTSPNRGRSRNRIVTSPPTPEETVSSNSRSRSASRSKQQRWLDSLEPDPGGRRSILHCDVNPYDLISRTPPAHNNEFAPDHDDIFDSKTLQDTLRRSSKKSNYKNIQEIAGQRISLGGTSSSALITQDGDDFTYDNVNSASSKKDNNGKKQSHHQQRDYQQGRKNGGKQSSTELSQPKRPPRRKHDASSADESNDVPEASTKAGNDCSLTAATLSHISSDLVASQKHGIKSILKRPSSVTSSVSSCSDTDAKYSSDTKNDTVATSDKVSTAGPPVKMETRGCDKAGTQFYLPLPQTRKKVQFMVEDKIIHDDENEDNDAPRESTGARDEGLKPNYGSVREQHQKQQEILELLQQGSSDSKTPETELRDEVMKCSSKIVVGGESTPEAPHVELQLTDNSSSPGAVYPRDSKPSLSKEPQSPEEENKPDVSVTVTTSPRRAHPLRRTHSDRRSNTTTIILNFNDTMALRVKNTRADCRDLFAESSQQHQHQHHHQQQSTDAKPPDTFPSPPSFSSSTSDPGSLSRGALVAQVSVTNDKTEEKGSEDLKEKQHLEQKPQPSRPPRQVNKKISWQENGVVMIKNDPNNPLEQDDLDKENSGSESIQEESRVVSNASVISLNCKTAPRIQQQHQQLQKKEKEKILQAQKEIYNGARLFGNQNKSPSQKTVVRVAPFNKTSSEVHRLKINHKDEGNTNNNASQKKTSILINGDDCYSTVNVNNDTPIYQSSVVVTDGTKILPGDALKVSSNTVTINVSNSRTPEEEIIYKNNKINSLLSMNKTNTVIPIVGLDKSKSNAEPGFAAQQNGSSKRGRTLITLDYDKAEETKLDDVLPHEEELVKILRNPVEAVRRNLVPHVCGKHSSSSGSSQEKSSKGHNPIDFLATLKQEKNSFIGKLLEDPTLSHLAEGLDSEVVVKLIENSLKRLKDSRNSIDTSGTKDNDDMAKLIDMSLQKIKEERLKMELNKKQQDQTAEDQENQSNRGSISSGNSFSSANYELFDFDNNESDCYHSCSSEITGDDDATSTRSKFYQMLVDATLSEIEISTNTDDDHHYESIRLNGDPIYEEISDVPPPLPLSPPPLVDSEIDKKNIRSMFEGASKYDILSYLVDAKERGIVKEEAYEYNFSNTSDIIVEEEVDTLSDLNKKQITDISSRISHLSITSDSSEDTSLTNSVNEKLPILQRKPTSDIERNDSGVGSETSKSSRSKYQNPPGCVLHKNSPIHLCEDCDGPVETQVTDSGVMYAPLVCRKCGKKRAERKEIITEIVETEEKYGRDLQIILEEFCHPMLVAGLLTQEQLSAIFLNTEELLENNQTLAERMRDALDIALEQGDDDLLTVNIGKIFLEATPMLHAFESYCVRQAAASLLLANLEKEKELLRIFLRVSQMENTVLRRMNLNSFLMVPVQRVTKYPLLLARLYKVTPPHLEGRELLKQAQENIELHLNHMNQEAKDVPTKLWRRISSSSPNRRASCEIDMINIKLRKMAIDVLEWNHDEVRFAMEGKLLFTQPTDSNWKKGRTIKLTPVNALLVTNGKPSANYKAEKAASDQLNFPKHTGIREASLLLVKEKCGRYTLIREPLYLDRCVVCTEADWDDYFEVHEISSKDTFIFKAEDGVRTKQWYTQLQYHAQGMGAWRKRRNALANIMINGMLSRT